MKHTRRKFLTMAGCTGLVGLGTFQTLGEENGGSLTRKSYPIMEGSKRETTVYVATASKSGPTVMVVGGMHGNEQAGYLAADQIKDWNIDRGTLVTIPRANAYAVKADRRAALNGYDLNRQFPTGKKPRTKLARAIWDVIETYQPQVLIDLHSSRGIWNGSMIGGVGQAIFHSWDTEADQEGNAAAEYLNDHYISRDKYEFTSLRFSGPSDQPTGLLTHKVARDTSAISYLAEVTSQETVESNRVKWHRVLTRQLSQEKLFTANDKTTSIATSTTQQPTTTTETTEKTTSITTSSKSTVTTTTTTTTEKPTTTTSEETTSTSTTTPSPTTVEKTTTTETTAPPTTETTTAAETTPTTTTAQKTTIETTTPTTTKTTTATETTPSSPTTEKTSTTKTTPPSTTAKTTTATETTSATTTPQKKTTTETTSSTTPPKETTTETTPPTTSKTTTTITTTPSTTTTQKTTTSETTPPSTTAKTTTATETTPTTSTAQKTTTAERTTTENTTSTDQRTTTTTKTTTQEEENGRTNPPVAKIQATYPGTGRIGGDTRIIFDASESRDPDGQITNYQWDIYNNGEFEKTGKTIEVTPYICGTFTVILRVQSNDGATDTAKFKVTVS